MLWLISAGKGLLTVTGRLWAWLTAEPVRLAFFALLALCAFLCLRLSSVDGDRDKWRGLVKQYEEASQIVKDADAIADAEALDVAHDTKETIDASNERAKQAAAGSDDPLASGFDSLRKESAGGRDKASK